MADDKKPKKDDEVISQEALDAYVPEEPAESKDED